MKRRLAVAGLSLLVAALLPYDLAAAETVTTTDPGGDTVDADDEAVVSPTGDLTSVSVTYANDVVQLESTTTTETNPALDPQWASPDSSLVVWLSTKHDENPEYVAMLWQESVGVLTREVYNVERLDVPLCSGTDVDATNLDIGIPASCLGNPTDVRASFELTIDTAPMNDGNFSFDFAPDWLFTESAREVAAEGKGYWMVNDKSEFRAFGDAQQMQTLFELGVNDLNQPIIDMAITETGEGMWLVAKDGGVFSLGDAEFFGSTGAITLNKPIVAIAATPSGNGYWFVGSDGGVFSYGDAQFYGSTGNITLNSPIVGMAATTSGNGYWLVASDGGIFAFGDASFHGSTGSIPLNKPIVGMETTPSGNGYWLVASDGGIFSFGGAAFHGSTGSIALNKPIVGMAATTSGNGYWLAASDGGVFTYGDAEFHGAATAGADRTDGDIVAFEQSLDETP